jgi:hypothetical protein
MRYALFALLAFFSTQLAAQSSITGTLRSSPSPSLAKQLPNTLPNVSAVLGSPAQQRALSVSDEYHIGKTGVSCTLPGGHAVRVTLAEDGTDFLFVALKGAYGPAILANEWRVKQARQEYAVFAFYRECAVHLMADVKATRPADAQYPSEIIQASDCVSFMLTADTLNRQGGSNGLEDKVRDGLQREYGARYPASKNHFTQCRDRKYVSELLERTRKR